MFSASSELKSLSVRTAVSSPTAGTSPVRPATNTTSLPVLAHVKRSPTNTASCLGGINESSAAVRPLLNILQNSRTDMLRPSVSLSASSMTAFTLSNALPEKAASEGYSPLNWVFIPSRVASALKSLSMARRAAQNCPPVPFVGMRASELKKGPRTRSTADISRLRAERMSSLGLRFTPPR